MRTTPPFPHTSSWRDARLKAQGQLHLPFTVFLRHVDEPNLRNRTRKPTVEYNEVWIKKNSPLTKTKKHTGPTKEVGHANSDGLVTQRLWWIQNGSRNSRRSDHVTLEFVPAIINKSNVPSRVSVYNANHLQTYRFPLADSWHFGNWSICGLMHLWTALSPLLYTSRSDTYCNNTKNVNHNSIHWSFNI